MWRTSEGKQYARREETFRDCSLIILMLLRLTAGVSLRLSHGYDIACETDQYVTMADITLENFCEASKPPGHVSDWIPLRESTIRLLEFLID